MGCCFSASPTLENNKPLVDLNSIQWESPEPITLQEWHKKKQIFWETSPTFSGKKEIWDALKAITEASTQELAQAIVDAARITIPSGNPTIGCFDELGNHYIVPAFCFHPPKHLNCCMPIQPLDLNEPKQERTIHLRLNTGKDFIVSMHENDTWNLLIQKMHEQLETDPIKISYKLFYLGKRIDVHGKVYELKHFEDLNSIIQVMQSECTQVFFVKRKSCKFL